MSRDPGTEVAAIVAETLAGDVIGAYLHGSAVHGGLRPDSDIDVLAVSRRSMTVEERRELVRRLFEISGSRASRGPSRPVELTVVVQSEVRPWRMPPAMDLQYGEWLRDQFTAGALPMPAPNPDLAVAITMTLSAARTLLGPPPAEVLDPVPIPDLRRAIVLGIPDLLGELDTDTRNVVLTLARIWTTLATGEIRTKDGAADWALERLPPEHRPVLALARAAYLGDQEDRWDELMSRVRPHAVHVVAEIERLATASDLPPSTKARAPGASAP